MENLKPCPRGQTPKSVSIADNGSKWAYVSGDCCGEWNIEFRTQYHRIDTPECWEVKPSNTRCTRRGYRRGKPKWFV